MASTQITKGTNSLANKIAEKFGMSDAGGELINTLKQTAFKGEATDAQFTALLVVANQYGLNPFTREIYAFPDKQNGIVPVVGVDGWSRIINEHPQFDGLDFSMADDGSECTCVIYRKDRNHPIKVTEYFEECNRPVFKNKSGYEVKSPWQSHPKRMLRHKAMIQCARLAFGYTGIFDEDEAERIREVDITNKTVVLDEKKEPEPVYYTDEEFLNIEQKLKGYVAKGHDQEKIVNFIEAKGVLFTSAQKQEIELMIVEHNKPIEGELVNEEDDFAKAYEQADNQ